ncbi:hypothetical protein GVAV_000713 [Gurleya vavrai]
MENEDLFFMKIERLKEEEKQKKLEDVDSYAEIKKKAYEKTILFLENIDKKVFAMFCGYITKIDEKIYDALIICIESEDINLEEKMKNILIKKIEDAAEIINILEK